MFNKIINETNYLSKGQSQKSVGQCMSVRDRYDMQKTDMKAMNLSTDLLNQQLSQCTYTMTTNDFS